MGSRARVEELIGELTEITQEGDNDTLLIIARAYRYGRLPFDLPLLDEDTLTDMLEEKLERRIEQKRVRLLPGLSNGGRMPGSMKH